MKNAKSSSVYTKPEVAGLTCTSHRRITLEVWSSPDNLVARQFYVVETWKQPGRWGKSLTLEFEYVAPNSEYPEGDFVCVNPGTVEKAFTGSVMTSFYSHPSDPRCSLGIWTYMVKGDRLSPILLFVRSEPEEESYNTCWRTCLRGLALEEGGLKAFSNLECQCLQRHG
jgi:hypothetical protein